METRNSGVRPRVQPQCPASLGILILWVAALLAAGCGAPGEPTPPSPPVPAPISDVSAQQAGDGAQLTFTMPKKTVTGERLSESPAVEIVRGSLKPDGSPDKKSFRVVYTIPGSLVETYENDGRVQFNDPIPAIETKAHPGATIAYSVRTRASKKRASTDSNIVTVRLFPVAERIPSIQARVTEPAIELAWSAPSRTSGGDTLGSVSGYHVYRGEVDPSTPETPHQDFTQVKWRTPLKLLAPTPSNSYRDTSFDFGKTYLYIVRTVTLAEGGPLESSDSAPAIVAPRDIFPPAAPQRLVGAVLPGAQGGSSVVDLSWSINLETDLAGYRVYRSDAQGTRGQLLNTDLLPTPAYRDTPVQPGHRYWYTVTAVDRAGNESAPSAQVDVEIPQPSS